LRAYTVAAKTALTQGAPADVVVLSRNLFGVDPMEIHKTRVVLTILEGRVIFEGNK
jgi:predicted amidohydrolase YtcJ